MYFKNGNIGLSKKLWLNTIRHDNIDYLVSSLNVSYRFSKGGNSNVFILSNPQNEDQFAIKICKFDVNKPKGKGFNNMKRISRFGREVEALNLAKEKKHLNVINIFFDDYLSIGKKKFHYYVMEKADSDLSDYLNKNEVSAQQKLLLCLDILKGIHELHEEKIYHRDIKPDNIFRVNGRWKIGDLGLVDYRDSDFDIPERGERIGPIGWLSPEATNKCLNQGKGRSNPLNFDCVLDDKSDVFQLGKLFWYIFQGNIPIGQLRRGDFKISDSDLFQVLSKMLIHAKDLRYSLEDVEEGFSEMSKAYGI